jgi:hypothetical protein
MKLRNCFLVLLLLIVYYNNVKCDDEKFTKKIKLVNLNMDFVVDTIISKTNDLHNLPISFIHWGNDTTDNGIPPNKKFKKSKIKYPDWKKLKVKTFFVDFNQDSTKDILFLLEGKLIKNNTKKDTSMAFILFGRKGLDTIQTYKFDNLKKDSISSNEIMFVRINDLVADYQIGDNSGKPIYRLKKNNNQNQIIQPVIVEENLNTNISVYPNPTKNNIVVNTGEMDGEILLEIRDLNGKKLISDNVILIGNNYHKEFELSSFTNGIYIITIRLNNKPTYTTKIIKID